MPLIVNENLDLDYINPLILIGLTIPDIMKGANFYSKTRATEHSISELPVPKDIESLRVLHGALVSMKGVEILKLKDINLSSNRIEAIQGIQLMRSLEQINLSNNKIRHISCLEGLVNLSRLVLFNNQIESLDGLRQLSNNSGNHLRLLDLRSNRIWNLRDFEVLTGFHCLEEVSFDVGKATNPVCENKIDYNRALFKHLRPTVKRIDNKQYKDVQQSIMQPSKQTQERENKETSYVQDTRHLGYEVTRMEIMELQKIISFKDLILEEMKTKNLELTTHLNQRYKELIKREHELQRSEAQNQQLQKRGNKKDKQLQSLRSELNNMMRDNGKLSKQSYNKNSQMEKYIKEISQLKLENAEYRAVIKDNERKLSDFHSKTMDNVNSNSVKMEDIKRKYEKLHAEHSALTSEAYGFKQRIQQLNEICREWEFKFQRTHDQYIHSIEKELRSLQQTHDKKCEGMELSHKQDINSRHMKYKEQLDSVEAEFKGALLELGEKYKSLKKNSEEIGKQNVESQEMLRLSRNRNSELQVMVSDSRHALEKFRNDFVQLLGEKQQLLKELQRERASRSQEINYITQGKQKTEYEKSYLQRQLMNMKEKMTALELDLERGGRLEELNTAIEVKNQMLEDKNETIQALREENKYLKQSEITSRNEIQTINKKYNKNKQLVTSQQQQLQNTIAECDQIKEKYQQLENELQATREQLSSKEESLTKIEEYLTDFARAVKEKDDQISELLTSIQDCKKIIIRKSEETDLFRKEAQNIKREFNQKYDFYKNRDKEARTSIQTLNSKVGRLEMERAENQKSRQAAKENLQKLTKLFGG